MENETTTTETTPAAAAESKGVPSPKESIADAMKRIGGAEVFDPPSTEAPAAAEATPEKSEKAKRAKPKDEPAVPATGEVDQLKALAEKLGMALEDGKVTTTERVKLREERRANLAAIAQAERDALENVKKARGEWEPRIAKVEALESALKAGDYDALAKVAGFEDWNKLQDDVIQRLADPNYKRVRELEERLKRDDEERAKAKEDEERQQATQAELAAQANHKRGLVKVMGQSQDPLVKAMHDVPSFVNAVFNVQRKLYQESGGRDVTTPEAALKYVPEGGVSLYDELKSFFDRVSPIFAKPAAPPAGTPAQPKPKTAPVPPPAPAPRERPKFGSGFGDDARRRLTAAIEEDRRRERAGS